MALNIVYINFEEGSPKLIYQGETYSPEEFPIRVPFAEYNYVINNPDKAGEIGELIISLDECFERLLGVNQRFSLTCIQEIQVKGGGSE